MPTPKPKVQSPLQWKAANNESWRQEHFLVSIQGAAGPERGVQLEHRPDLGFDPIIDRGIGDNRAAEQISTSRRKARRQCGLNIYRTYALRSCERRGQY